MQVTSYAGGALGYSLRDLAFRSPAAPETADARARQLPDGAADDTGSSKTQHLRATQTESSDRMLHRMERLGRLLNRLLTVSGSGPDASGVLVAGPAGSHSGVVVSIPAERPNGTYLDVRRVQNSWMRFDGTALGDAVATTAPKVGAVDSGDGADALSIGARRVNGVATGQGADALSVAATGVRNIATDVDEPTAGAPDALAGAVLRLNGISTAGGDDAVAILGLRGSDVLTVTGSDAISVWPRRLTAARAMTCSRCRGV